MQAFKSAAQDGIQPFKDEDDPESPKEGDQENVAWIGPHHVGCCVIEIMGPLQLFFSVMVLVATAFLIIELYREGVETLRLIGGILFILVCMYLAYLSKAIYLIKAFRKEIDTFTNLNKQLKGQIQTLETENQEYDAKNKEQGQLNQELSQKIGDLAKVEKQLSVLSTQCHGNIEAAKGLVERLERNLKLDTVNSVFLFFDRADQDKSGCVDGIEIAQFVDSLGFLWQHLPQFDASRMKASIAKQGGLSLEQVHRLVDTMMMAPETDDPATLAEKVEGALIASDGNEATSNLS